MPVSSTHKEYDRYQSQIETVRDAVAGSKAVKDKGTRYLPGFIPEDRDRYEQYKERALFVNFTGRTLQGLIGCIFRRPYSAQIPASIEYMTDDIDGEGLTLEQFAKAAAKELMIAGRVGFLVDYPPTDPGLTHEQVNALNLRPVVKTYNSESIINWGKDLIVLLEHDDKPIDEFTSNCVRQYRVLDLLDGKFRIRLFGEDERQIGEDEFPRMANGSNWPFIPFVICGAESNTWDMDVPPLSALAEVNISHYRNSADYEEGVFIHGQGTLFVSSDMSTDQFKAANPSGILVGARTGHFLGSNGKAELLQMKDNSAALESMRNKEAQMLAIGAKMITGKTGTQTAEAARIEASSESSVLATIAGNLSDAVESCLEIAQIYTGTTDDVEFDLNREFYDQSMTPQELIAMIQLIDRGLIAKEDARTKLRGAGYIAPNRTDDEIDEDAEDNAEPI